MKLLLSNCTVIPMTAEGDAPRHFTGSVGIAGNRISFASPDAEEAERFLAAYPDARRIDCRDKIVMPGLVNTHCHVSMTLQRSSADDIALMEWLNDYIWPFEARQTADDIELGARLGVAEMLLGGVTSFVDMYWHEASVFNAVRDMGMRALLTASTLDSNLDACERDLEALLAKVDGCERIKAGLSPHAAYTCSEATLLRTKELCRRHGLRMTTHIAETLDETRIIAERYGCTPVERYDRLGMLDDTVIAAHCVHVTDSDIETLRERGVHVSHNPSSNMKIASGIAPVERMRERGVNCTVGTDGTCSNNDLDMWEEMRGASVLQKLSTMKPLAVPPYGILNMATVNGARALGHAGELGIIAPGALADIIVIDTVKPHMRPIHDPVSNLVYCAKASDVETVIVDGRIVVENRIVKGVDLGALCREVQRCADRLSGRTEGAR